MLLFDNDQRQNNSRLTLVDGCFKAPIASPLECGKCLLLFDSSLPERDMQYSDNPGGSNVDWLSSDGVEK